MCWVRVQRVPCPATHPLSVHAGNNPTHHGLFTSRPPSAATYDDLAHDGAGAGVTRSIHVVRVAGARPSGEPWSDRLMSGVAREVVQRGSGGRLW